MKNDAAISLFDEDEEDIETTLPPELRTELQNAFVYNLDWTVATVLAQLAEGAIDLQPQYQRRDAWTVGRKSKLIESLIAGLPIPHIVLAERHDQKGSFLILDGKQRLTTLAQFSSNLPDSQLNGFALRDVPLLPHLEGLTYRMMLEVDAHKATRTAFLNQPLRTAILRGWTSEDLLHLVFHRLNSQVVPLSPQELRQALIRGPFMAYLNEYSANSRAMQGLLGLSGPDFRMRDSELLLRLLGLTKYGAEYRGDLRRFLDRVAKRLSASWTEWSAKTESDFRSIEDAVDLWSAALGEDYVGRKFTEGKYEGRLNRAVLDAQVFAALHQPIADLLVQNPVLAKATFEGIMTTDHSFRRSIEATTKSTEAVRYRMERLRDALASA